MTAPTTTVTIDERFQGPPGGANGGYASGILAATLDEPAASVRLVRRVPLGRALTISAGELHDGEELIAMAFGVAPDDLPAPPRTIALAEAREAAGRSKLAEPGRHPFPHCFGCGPLAPPDALHNRPGPVGDGTFAVTWTPADSLPRSPDGTVAREILWAALDCPSSGPVEDAEHAGTPHVLGTLAVRIDAPVQVGAEHAVLAWPIGAEGRKVHTGCALLDAGERVLAVSRATWIALTG